MRASCFFSTMLVVLGTGCESPGPASAPVTSDTGVAGIDGRLHDPLGVESGLHALVFIRQDCPIANAYAPELNRIVNRYGRRVRFFLVHVDPEITPAEARDHAEEFGFRCSVLLDREHRLVAATGATVTPEACVLDATGVRYRGRIDDLHVDFGKRRSEASRPDFRNALDTLLRGGSVAEPWGPAVGCFIADLSP